MTSASKLWLLKFNTDDNNHDNSLPPLELFKEEELQSGSIVSSVTCGGGNKNNVNIVTENGRVFTADITDNNGACSFNTSLWKQPSGLSNVASVYQVESGISHHVALSTDQEVLAWGRNKHGQQGRQTASGTGKKGKGKGKGNARKTNDTFHNPRVIQTLQNVKAIQISCGNNHTLCLSEVGNVYAWGANDRGQLGNKSDFARPNPIPAIVKHLENICIVQLAAGGEHSIALSASGQVYSWGSNTFGQLGIKCDVKTHHIPVKCPPFCDERITSISCGENHTTFLTQGGHIYTCGKLGNNHEIVEIKSAPQKIVSLEDTVVTQIACGRNCTLAYAMSSNMLHILGHEKDKEPVKVKLPNPDMRSTLTCGKNVLCVLQQPIGNDRGQRRDRMFGHFTLDVIKDSMAWRQLNENKKKHMLEIMCSSASCINGSFVKNYGTFVCSSTNHGLDLEKAEQCFYEVRSIIPEKALIKLTRRLKNSEFLGNEDLRILLLLPSCLFSDSTNVNDDVILNLADLLLCLDDSLKKVLGNWLKTSPKTFFKRYLLSFKRLLTHTLKYLHRVTDTIKNIEVNTIVGACVQVMDMLNEINHCRRKIVSHSHFHIHNLVDIVNIDEDYKARIDDLPKGQESNFRFCKYPFLYNDAGKFQLFKAQCETLKEYYTIINMRDLITTSGLPLKIDRYAIIKDAKALMSRTQAQLHVSLNVIFVDELDYSGNGIRQEFFQKLFDELLREDKSLNEDNLLHEKIKVVSYEDDSNAQWFMKDANLDDVYFLGMMCGLAMYNSVTIHLQFPLAIYKKILKKPVTFRDLFYLKPTVYRSLKQVLENEHDDIESVYGLDFASPDELCPNGADIPVTQANKIEYVNKVTDYYLNTSVETVFKRFYEGFTHIVPEDLLISFHPEELEATLVGNERYDFDLLEKTTQYTGGFTKESHTVKLFWEAFHEMKLDDQKKFLEFLTGTQRIPAYGIDKLNITLMPIISTETEKDPDAYLPRAFTCTYTLSLPKYTNKDTMRNNILMAVNHAAGFTTIT